jgi:hypothetical protein
MRSVSVTTTIEKRPIAPVGLPARPPMWMIQEDPVLFGGIRSCAPCPAVVVLKEDSHAFMDEQWQYYLRAINYAMDLEDVYLLLDKSLAFANQTGFRKDGSPKADYFHMKDLQYKPPSLDKVRSCVRNVLTGNPQFSLMQTLKDGAALAQTIFQRKTALMAARSTFASLLTTANNVLNVWTFNSTKPPPLKPGRKYPTRVQDVNPDDYLYMPERDPEKFLVANIVNNAGGVVQFPRGGLYSWTGNHTPYSFLPHISNHSYGDVLYSLANLLSIGPNVPIPSPYRVT